MLRKQRGRRLLLAVVVFGLWVLVAWAAAKWLIVNSPLAPADVIVVLSGSAVYRERTQRAAEYYRQGLASRILLTNDTGPMHVAAALGTPVVVPFGSTSPELTGPVSSGATTHHLLTANAPCAPCFRRECPIDFCCMTGISVEGVVEAVIGSFGK